MWWNWSNLLSWGHMYQRLQRWVLDAKSMLTLTEVAVTTSVPCWVEIKHSAVVVGVGRHEPISGLLLLLLLVVIVIIVVFSVVVVTGLALTESALTEWSLAKEGCVGQRKKYMRFKKYSWELQETLKNANASYHWSITNSDASSRYPAAQHCRLCGTFTHQWDLGCNLLWSNIVRFFQ